MAKIKSLLTLAGTWLIGAVVSIFKPDEAVVTRLTSSVSVAGSRAPDKRQRRKRFCVLHNPSAGRNGIDFAVRVVENLRRRDADAQIFELTRNFLPPREMAEKFDAVIVSGGDGSMRSVAAAYSGALPVSLIPNGTGNVLANELALPKRAEALSELFVSGPTRTVQGCTASGEPFLLMFGAGFDGEIVRDVSRTALRSYGKLAYAGPILRALLRKPRLFEIDTDGTKSVASWILVTNVSRYGGRFHLTDRTSIHVPGLIAITSHATTRLQRLGEVLSLVLGRLERVRTIDIRPVLSAAVVTPGIPAQVDGEPLSPRPYDVRQGGFQMTIVAP